MSDEREAAYERAAQLYAAALKTGGAALEVLGSSRWKLNPSPQEFHANVLAVAEFLIAAPTHAATADTDERGRA